MQLVASIRSPKRCRRSGRTVNKCEHTHSDNLSKNILLKRPGDGQAMAQEFVTSSLLGRALGPSGIGVVPLRACCYRSRALWRGGLGFVIPASVIPPPCVLVIDCLSNVGRILN